MRIMAINPISYNRKSQVSESPIKNNQLMFGEVKICRLMKEYDITYQNSYLQRAENMLQEVWGKLEKMPRFQEAIKRADNVKIGIPLQPDGFSQTSFYYDVIIKAPWLGSNKEKVRLRISETGGLADETIESLADSIIKKIGSSTAVY